MKAVADLRNFWKQDLTAGFILSLIALPLCIGIAGASIGSGSATPAVSGLMAAVVGGMIVSRFTGTNVAIHGPAAGLIVIVQHGIESLSHGDMKAGFQRFLAAMVVAGVLQIITGVLKLGRYAALFPVNVIHGMLAAIGVIIISKQIHVALGVTPVAKSPLGLYAEVPHSLAVMNQQVAIIGGIALLIMIFFFISKSGLLKKIPAPLVAVIAGAALAASFGIDQKFLVTLPASIIASLPHPDFSMITSHESLITIFAVYFVASLESLLSATAVDKLDLEKRATNLDKEIIANGIGNTILGLIGGLPIIAEIVRSSANVTNGAKSPWANFFHGSFLAVFLFLIPGIIHLIPNAALAGILILVGFRLARPSEFKHAFDAGVEQLAIFLTTLIITLVEDLLVGIAAGLVVKLLILALRGVKPSEFFKLKSEVTEQGNVVLIKPHGSLIFTNLISLTDKVQKAAAGKSITVDFADVHYIDHTSMAALVDLKFAQAAAGNNLEMKNIDLLKPYTSLPTSARRADRHA